ncbi:MAG: PIN domain-containing protein [Actinobacteria bacterium]|nr:PIN domain-containing protein [Actinomycetota bacterium]
MNGDLLDTSILIAPDTTAFGELPAAAAISVITLGELHAGVLLARDDRARADRRHRFEAVRAAFAPLPVDEPVVMRYGEILAVARSQRRTAKATDLLIIATAAAHDRKLHTHDERQAELARAAGIPVRTI